MSADEYVILDASGLVTDVVVGAPPPGSLPAGHEALPRVGEASIGWRRDAGGTLVPPGGAPAPIDLAEYARAASKAIEAEGVVLAGVRVATDRESQGLIDRAVGLLAANPSLPAIRFDPGGDAASLTLDRATMTAIGVAVGMRVQEAFARRCDALDGIRAGTVTTTAAIDAILVGSS